MNSWKAAQGTLHRHNRTRELKGRVTRSDGSAADSYSLWLLWKFLKSYHLLTEVRLVLTSLGFYNGYYETAHETMSVTSQNSREGSCYPWIWSPQSAALCWNAVGKKEEAWVLAVALSGRVLWRCFVCFKNDRRAFLFCTRKFQGGHRNSTKHTAGPKEGPVYRNYSYPTGLSGCEGA